MDGATSFLLRVCNMGSEVLWNVDVECVLGGFAYHDGRIVALCYESEYEKNTSNDVLALKVLNSAGKLVSIRFVGSTKMNVSDFWLSPIVNTIIVYQNTLTNSYFAAEEEFWATLLPDAAGRSEEYRQQEIKRLSSSAQGMYFVMIIATYGLRLAVICKRVEVYIDDGGNS